MEIWQTSEGKESHIIHVWTLGLTTTTFACILVNGKNVWPMLPLSLLTNIESRMPMLMKVQLWENNLEKKEKKNIKENQKVLM